MCSPHLKPKVHLHPFQLQCLFEVEKVALEPWRLRQCLKIWGLVLWLLDDLAGADSLEAAQINILSNFLYIFFHLLLTAAFRVTVSSNIPVIIKRDERIHSVQVTSSSQAHTHKDTHTIHSHLWQFRVYKWPNVHIFGLCDKTHTDPGRTCTIQKDPSQSLSINYFVPSVQRLTLVLWTNCNVNMQVGTTTSSTIRTRRRSQARW